MILLGIWLLGTGLLQAQDAPGPIRTLVIDAGHGGKDPGALGRQYREKDITLQVALRLRALLRERMPELNVVMTRDTDQFVELHRRATIALDAGGDCFLSIHCNAHRNRSHRGATSYILGINEGQEGYEHVIAENEAILFEDNYRSMYGGFNPSSPEGFIYLQLLKNSFRSESLRLAGGIQQQLQAAMDRGDRGVRQAPFVVLYLSGMPAVLCEIGFISNAQEEQFIGSELGQIYIAQSLFRAIEAYNRSFTEGE
ncbi:MAG: N-acetylmuramoyl-L-alanine amidase [Bacteroidia bacterium]|nr:N-acetylmuramoyl-L-alanine amidase [Bacteroidia bacterium]